MNQSDVIRAVEERRPDTVERTLEALFSVHEEIGVIVEQLRLGDKVVFPGFGTFYTEDRKARKFRDPRTGHLCTSPSRRLIKFRPSESLQALIDGSPHRTSKGLSNAAKGSAA